MSMERKKKNMNKERMNNKKINQTSSGKSLSKIKQLRQKSKILFKPLPNRRLGTTLLVNTCLVVSNKF